MKINIKSKLNLNLTTRTIWEDSSPYQLKTRSCPAPGPLDQASRNAFSLTGRVDEALQ